MKKSLIVSVFFIIAIIALSATIIVFLNNTKPSMNSAAAQYTFTIVNTYPHDTNAFTEGLVYSDGFLFEGTGLNGTSSLRQVNLTTDDIVNEVTLPYQYFGEGITIVNNTIIQLTWQSHIGFIYDKNTFALIGNFTYPTEGWGLTFDGKNLIMSDGTNSLYFMDPTTFQRIGQIQVHDGKTNVTNINELEYINSEVYANIWQTNTIAIINPETGQIKAWINLAGLPAENNSNPEAVLNGIAYDKNDNRLFVTGKDWPSLYQIEIRPETNSTT